MTRQKYRRFKNKVFNKKPILMIQLTFLVLKLCYLWCIKFVKSSYGFRFVGFSNPPQMLWCFIVVLSNWSWTELWGAQWPARAAEAAFAIKPRLKPVSFSILFVFVNATFAWAVMLSFLDHKHSLKVQTFPKSNFYSLQT